MAHGWTDPLGGTASNYGAWYTLAFAVGASWLGILIIDAVISPGGTGLVYLGTTARLSYALGEEPEMPQALATTNQKGVPVVVDHRRRGRRHLRFGPFKSWSELVSVVTGSTAIMYAFAPVALGSLQLLDKDRSRPYKMPMPKILLPAGFAFADLLIYWSGWDIIWKLDILLIVGFALFFAGATFKKTDALSKISHAVWIGPWLIGMTILSFAGRYGAWGPKDDKAAGYSTKNHPWLTQFHDWLPSYVDLAAVIVFAVLIYYWAIRCVMSRKTWTPRSSTTRTRSTSWSTSRAVPVDTEAVGPTHVGPTASSVPVSLLPVASTRRFRGGCVDGWTGR